jgi:hypothetical protein
MLDLRISINESTHISKYQEQSMEHRPIIINQHCFGCTAGAGSSCGGELT